MVWQNKSVVYFDKDKEDADFLLGNDFVVEVSKPPPAETRNLGKTCKDWLLVALILLVLVTMFGGLMVLENKRQKELVYLRKEAEEVLEKS